MFALSMEDVGTWEAMFGWLCILVIFGAVFWDDLHTRPDRQDPWKSP